MREASRHEREIEGGRAIDAKSDGPLLDCGNDLANVGEGGAFVRRESGAKRGAGKRRVRVHSQRFAVALGALALEGCVDVAGRGVCNDTGQQGEGCTGCGDAKAEATAVVGISI